MKFLNKEKKYFYVKVFENKIKITDLETGETIESIPKQVYSSGRLLIGNFENAVTCLQTGLDVLIQKKLVKPVNFILIQPMEKSDEISNVEKQLLEELALEAASSNLYIAKVSLWFEESLSNYDAMQLLIKR